MSEHLPALLNSPLGWVYPEIEVALGEVLRTLAEPDWEPPSVRIGVLAHLHQVSGALRMVELPGPQRLAEELEAALRALPAPPAGDETGVLSAAITFLRGDLDRRLRGQPVRDLDALPSLQAVATLHREPPAAVELFFPDLEAFPPAPDRAPTSPSPEPAERASTPDPARAPGASSLERARHCRAGFQRALSQGLRRPRAPEVALSLAAAVRAVAAEAPGRPGPQRWQVLADVLSELPAVPGQDDRSARRFYARIDRALRTNGTDDDHPHDELLREAVWLGAQLSAPGPAVQQHLRAARVPELLAPLPALGMLQSAAAGRPELPALAQALREGEELLEAWFREQGPMALPPALAASLATAATQLDALGEDAALVLLDDARERLADFPPAQALSEARLLPVAEILAGLHHYADALLACDPLADGQLDALRARLREIPGGAQAETGRPAATVPDLVAQAIDETLLGVFVDEADTRLRALHSDAQALLAVVPAGLAGLAALPLGRLRAGLHTLRGSGLVAGLVPLAQLAGEVDQTLAACEQRADSQLEASAQLVIDAARAMERWLARLAADRLAPLQAVELIDRARALRAKPALSLAPLISLQDIFLEEAGDRVAELRTALGSQPQQIARTGDALRAAHTLAGIARTAEHPALAELARALETVFEVLRLRPEAPAADATRRAACERVHAASLVLADMHAALVAGQPLQAAEDWVRALRHDADLLRNGTPPIEVVAPASAQATEPLAAGDSARVSAEASAPANGAEPPLPADAVDAPDADLLPVFLEEWAELMPRLEAALRAWSEGAPAEQGARALKRALHTLKGSARMSGLLQQGAIAHRLEDLVLRAAERAPELADGDFEAIQAGLDRLVDGIDAWAQPASAASPAAARPGTASPGTASPGAAAGTSAAPRPELPAPLAVGVPLQRSAADAAVAAALAAAAVTSASAPGTGDSAASTAAPANATAAAAEAATPAREATELLPDSAVLRLKVETLDHMANAAGEAGIARARIETETGTFKRGLSDLAENIQRLKSQLREIEIHAERALPAAQPESGPRHGFDPLEFDRYTRLQELVRTLTEGIDDVQTVHQGLRRGVDEVELALRSQGRVVRDLQQDLLRARMVPFAAISERLQRTVRQAAREAARELQLEIEGAQHEIDRSILERLAAPLEHLLRNAAVHGIEAPDVRRDLHKPPQGRLAIRLVPGEHEVTVHLSDDGRGVDLDRVRALAEARGLLGTQPAAGDEELLQMIFRPGFSTAHSVTSLAGRGVGLDVVRSEVQALGGRIHLDTKPGAGTEFTLVIPVTLATVQAVVVRAGDAWFAIPAPLVEQVRPVPRELLAELYREPVAHWQGLRYPFSSLSRVLGIATPESEPQGAHQLVFLRSADRRCALRVDELAGTQEIVVKTVSPHVARIPGVVGASVLGNGRIVLILNPVTLAIGRDGQMPPALQPMEPLPQASTVMVVDDSITVRRVTSRLLERAGYQVRLAKDGLDALEQLEGSLPEAILLDVEMPRLDGFELIDRLRSNPRTASLPVIVITSRTAERHRSHAESLGVQGYLGKPYREEDLLALLAALPGVPAAPAARQPPAVVHAT